MKEGNSWEAQPDELLTSCIDGWFCSSYFWLPVEPPKCCCQLPTDDVTQPAWLKHLLHRQIVTVRLNHIVLSRTETEVTPGKKIDIPPSTAGPPPLACSWQLTYCTHSASVWLIRLEDACARTMLFFWIWALAYEWIHENSVILWYFFSFYVTVVTLDSVAAALAPVPWHWV